MKKIKPLPIGAIVELPGDAKEEGYRETRPFHHEQVFSSVSLNFTGTEKEFYYAGLCGAYTVPWGKHNVGIWDNRPRTGV